MEAHLLEWHQQGVGSGGRRLCVHRCRRWYSAYGDLLGYQEGSGKAYPHHRKNLRKRETNRQLATKASGGRALPLWADQARGITGERFGILIISMCHKTSSSPVSCLTRPMIARVYEL